jgi:hypothetical protein
VNRDDGAPLTPPDRDADEAAAKVLERRYRRLLAFYPADYRAANADDMLGVALARSVPGQRWPGLGETTDLVLSGVRRRLGAGLRNPVRRDTAAVVAIAGPILLAALSVWSLSGPFQDLPMYQFYLPLLARGSFIAMAVWWLLVAVAGMLSWRRLAAASACAGTVALLALAIAGFVSTDITGCLQILLALLATAAALGAVRAEARPLSWPAAMAVTVGASIVPGWPLGEAASVTVGAAHTAAGDGSVFTASSPLFGAIGWWDDAALACLVIAMTVATGWLRPAVRKRVVALVFPLAVVLAIWCWDGHESISLIRFQAMSSLFWFELVLVVAVGTGIGLAAVAVCKRMRHRLAKAAPAR